MNINNKNHQSGVSKCVDFGFFSFVVALLLALPAWAAGPPAISLPKTGQTICYDAMGSVVSCTGTGQDGEIQAGVAWPNPRFLDNGNQTITDNLTGLIWAKDAGTPAFGTCTAGSKSWLDAMAYIACLNANSYLGISDWILPNKGELASLVNIGPPDLAAWLTTQGFANIQTDTTGAVNYWSSSTLANDTAYGWDVSFSNYYVGERSNTKTNNYYVWPVRAAGQTGSPVISLAKTGQTTSYAAGDDGALQRGVAWPSPRFADNGNQTITDSLTGLVWSKDGNAPGPTSCVPGVAKIWQGALDYVACLNSTGYLGFTDWRLPNKIELVSLSNLGQPDSAIWLTAQGFTNVQYDAYWSSSTALDQVTVPGYVTQLGWLVAIFYNNVGANFKEIAYNVWPVRGGMDFIPPNVTIAATPNILWPPNHKMVNVVVSGTAGDNESGLASVVITVEDEYGKYNMTVSGFGSTIQLEAWREGADKNGRIYTITAVATDHAGNQSTASTKVTVPHDMRK